MPQYEFRCNSCQEPFLVSYKTFVEYETASIRCPDCGAEDVTRTFSQVAIGKSNRDYSRMSSREMLSVLEAGDPGQVDSLFRQVNETSPQRPAPPATEPAERADDASRAGAQKLDSQ
jgi:putative FmdB family regulatory protein